MTNGNGFIYTFGGYTFDSRQNVLMHGAQEVALPARTLKLLRLFVENPNEIISKETILTEVWDGAFVEDGNITVHVSRLRKIFAEDDTVSIQTFPKVGYRLNGTVRVTERANGNGVVAISDNKTSLKPRPQIAFAVAAILLASLAVATFWRARPKPPPKITRIDGFERVTQYAFSPDGQYAAQVTNRGGKFTLTMIHLGSNSRVDVGPPGDLAYARMLFTRDSNQLFFTRIGLDQKISLYRTAILRPEPVKVLDNIAYGFALSPSSDRVAYVEKIEKSKTSIVTAKLDGTEKRVLSSREGAEKYWPWSIDWSPDGAQLAVALTVSGKDASSRLVMIDANTGQESSLSDTVWTAGGGEGLAWTSDGSGVVFSASAKGGGPSQLWHVARSGGSVDKITNDVEAYAYPFITNNGRIYSAQFEIVAGAWSIDPPFDVAAPLSQSYKHDFNWLRADSLGHIVFGSNAMGGRNVWIMNSDGTDERQLTQNAGNNVMPVPAADGQFIIFVSTRGEGGKSNLWRINYDGSGAKQITNGPGEFQPTISPDGKWIYYSSGGVNADVMDRRLWRVPADGGTPAQIVNEPSHGADVSPDGKLIAAWYKPTDGDWKLAIFNAHGGSPVKQFDISSRAPVKWTPEGRFIAYLKESDGVKNVWKQPVDGGPAVQVTKLTSLDTLNFDWTNNNRIICSRRERSSNIVLITDFL